MSLSNLFFASDKAVFDALQQFRYTNADIKNLFLSRGILVSHETKRINLAKYFSRLNHDYYDHQSIATILGIGHKKEKTSITNINNQFSIDGLEKIAIAVETEYQSNGDNVSHKVSKKGVELKFVYTQMDYNKSEFRQVIEREAIVSIEKDSDGVVIRWPHNDYVEVIKERILDLLESSDELDGDLEINEIEITSITSPELRTKFFFELLSGMEGYEMHDVTDVHVYHPKMVGDEEDTGVHVFKAALKGEGVHNSEEISSLYKKGYYISKIVWMAKTDSYDSDLYELEAQFGEPENCRNFSYLVKGFYKYKDRGEYSSGRTTLPNSEEIRLGRLIETSAKNAKSKVGNEI